MKIKGHKFGEGIPTICVPVTEQTEDEIIAKIEEITRQGAAMIEWRMDWYEAVASLDAVSKMLEKIAPLIKNTVFLCTFRSKKQGGERSLREEEYLALNSLAAESGIADMVDLEFYEISHPMEVIGRLQKKGAAVVCSNHNFTDTPELETMKKQLTDMIQAGAEFSKLAVMPREKKDVLRLMEAVTAVKAENPDSHVIAMSMGKLGMISRLLGQWYGSEVTFAALGKNSAPGQASYSQVQTILKAMEECGR